MKETPRSDAETRWSARSRGRSPMALTASVAVLLAAGALGTVAHAGSRTGSTEPVRSGTVVNPANHTGPVHCASAPDCRVWLESDCDARLTGRDPAAFASIVDVRELAGSRRHITFGGVGGTWMNAIRGAYYEFWSRDCVRVGSVLVDDDGPTVLAVPPSAVWMTVPGQSGPYRWELR